MQDNQSAWTPEQIIKLKKHLFIKHSSPPPPPPPPPLQPTSMFSLSEEFYVALLQIHTTKYTYIIKASSAYHNELGKLSLVH